MKNKKTAWILLPAVLAIWGFLGWKVYAAMTVDEPMVVFNPEVNDELEKEKLIPDTYQLLLDYNDPFLKGENPNKHVKQPIVNGPPKNANTEPKKQPQPPAQKSWPEIRYSGLVKSPKDGKMVGFLSINGTSHFVKPGEVIGEVTVREIWKDSVKVVMGKESRFVRK